MNNRKPSADLEHLEKGLNELKSQIEQLQQQINQLSQAQRTELPTSAQEQFAQEIQARSQQPDQNIEQYAGR